MTRFCKIFWENHDPTQGMQQGNDVGTQDRSAIYCTTPEQKRAAEASRTAYQDRLTAAGYGRITTEIAEAPPFYYAEDYHQQYPGEEPEWLLRHRWHGSQLSDRGESLDGPWFQEPRTIIPRMSRVVYVTQTDNADQELLRVAHQVRLVSEHEEGTGVNALPGGVFGFTYSPGLPNAPLFAVRRYRTYRRTSCRAATCL